MYFAGVDIGSTMTKVVIFDEVVLASVIGPTGAEHRRLANKVMEEALERANLSFDELSYIVATGYGRMRGRRPDRCQKSIPQQKSARTGKNTSNDCEEEKT